MKQPVVVIGDHTFAGKYSDIAGTSLFFRRSKKDQDEGRPSSSAFDREPSDLQLFAKTGKRLVLKRVFLKPRPTEETEKTATTAEEGQKSSSR